MMDMEVLIDCVRSSSRGKRCYAWTLEPKNERESYEVIRTEPRKRRYERH